MTGSRAAISTAIGTPPQQWGRSMFPEYDVEIGKSLLDSDPSFLLKLVRKRAGSQPHAADGTPGTPDG